MRPKEKIFIIFIISIFIHLSVMHLTEGYAYANDAQVGYKSPSIKQTDKSSSQAYNKNGSKVYIVAIGVNRNNLKYCDMDAINFAGLIKRKFNVPDKNIKLMTNGIPTLKRVRKEIQSLKRLSPDSTVFIYFSGHGTSIPDQNDDEEDGYDEAFVLVGSVEEQRETLYIDDDFRTDLAAIPAEKKVVVVDSCHSGTITKSLDEIGPIKYMPLAYLETNSKQNNTHVKGDIIDVSKNSKKHPSSIRNVVLLSACTDSQSAREERGKGGVFTNCLLKEMKQGVNLSLESIFEKTRRDVLKVTGNKQDPQKNDPKYIASTIYF